jgi:cytochrome c553
MNHASSLIAVLSASGALIALDTVSAQNPNGSDTGRNAGNSLGMQIATGGASNGVAACASCHGMHGEGNAAAGFPRLAGQWQYYLARQMTSFANGSRNNAVMSPIAKMLTQQQIDAVSAYYAALFVPSSKPVARAPPKMLERGRILATVGDNSREIQACANCHGPGGVGEPPTYPYLAGQHGSYLIEALAEWKNGIRNTDPSQQMSIIAKHLVDDDVAAVAAYYSMQPAPAYAQRSNIPAGSAARPVKPGAPPATGSQPVQGIGTEQGAPTTGGSVGPGGGGGASGAGASGSGTGKTP